MELRTGASLYSRIGFMRHWEPVGQVPLETVRAGMVNGALEPSL